jgi:hypothetical protein
VFLPDLPAFGLQWQRAKDTAASLPEVDPHRANCLEIAEGYEKLARTLEERSKLEKREPTTHGR